MASFSVRSLLCFGLLDRSFVLVPERQRDFETQADDRFVFVAFRRILRAFGGGEEPAFDIVIAAGLFERHPLGGGLRVELRRLEVRASCRIFAHDSRWQNPRHQPTAGSAPLRAVLVSRSTRLSFAKPIAAIVMLADPEDAGIPGGGSQGEAAANWWRNSLLLRPCRRRCSSPPNGTDSYDRERLHE